MNITTNLKKLNSETVFYLKIFLKSTFVIFILFLIYPFSISSALADTNLVLNPSFEIGKTIPINWAFVTQNGNTPVLDTRSHHNGSKSIKISVSGTRDRISGYPKSNLIIAQPLTTYTASVWGKTQNTGGTNTPAVRVVELDASKKWISQTNLPVFGRGTNDWTQRTVEFQTAANTRYLYVYANIWKGYGTFWVDDVNLSMKAGPAPTPTPAPTASPTPTFAPSPAPTPDPTPKPTTTPPIITNPIGGGAGYADIINKSVANYLVSTRDQLLLALSSAKSGQIIYVDDNAQIDLSLDNNGNPYRDIHIPAGVTLASGRGNGNSLGALIYSSQKLFHIMHDSVVDGLHGGGWFTVSGNGVRITGLRLRGPVQDIGTYEYPWKLGRGIYTEYNTRIDNNEIYGWSFCGICVYWTDTHTSSPALIQYNYIHHNRMYGMGYGVDVAYGGNAIIEYNNMDYNRHAISSWGTPTDQYIARYNIVMHGNGHAFDMHGGSDREDSTVIAGKKVEIYGNTIGKMIDSSDSPGAWAGVVIRGIPNIGAYIHDNYLYYDFHDYNLAYVSSYPGEDNPIVQKWCVWPEGVDPICEPTQRFFVTNNCYNGKNEVGASCNKI